MAPNLVSGSRRPIYQLEGAGVAHRGSRRLAPGQLHGLSTRSHAEVMLPIVTGRVLCPDELRPSCPALDAATAVLVCTGPPCSRSPPLLLPTCWKTLIEPRRGGALVENDDDEHAGDGGDVREHTIV